MGFFDKNVIREENTLFKNEVALSYDFLPKDIPYREQQQQLIANALKPLFVGRNGRNLIITGRPGIGKTAATKFVLREVEDNYSEEIYTFFINCWQLNSSFKVAEYICHELGFKLTQNKKTNELFSIAEKIINKKTAVFVFDEIDKAEDYDFLYEILENVYTKSFLLITNYANWIDNLDERIKSRLMAEVISFRTYSLAEVNGILKERVSYAFVDNVFSDEVISAISEKAYQVGDIRVGIHLLRECGLLSQERKLKFVDMEIANVVINKISSYKDDKKVKSLDDDERLVYELIRDNPNLPMTDLFDQYQKTGGKGVYKTFTRKIKALENSKVILTKTTGGGPKGNTTTIELNTGDDEEDSNK
ncbi:MAG: AAA family ATPase [Candidatus Woesearchaeota archaeon]|jgi:cell division control protein 6